MNQSIQKALVLAVVLGTMLSTMLDYGIGHLPQMIDEIEQAYTTAKHRREASVEWQTTANKTLEEQLRLIRMQASSDWMCPPTNNNRVSFAKHWGTVSLYNRMVDYYITALLRSVGGSQYRGVEKTFPKHVKPCLHDEV